MAVRDLVHGKRVLVTGAAGFIGCHLTRRLCGLGARVHASFRRPPQDGRLDGLDFTPEPCDFADAAQIAAMAGRVRPDLVFHLAASGVLGGQTDTEILRINVEGSAALLDALAGTGVESIVNVGSCFEYGEGALLTEDSPLRPTQVYGASKAAAHLLAHALRRNRGLPVVTVRPFTPFGPWEAPRRLVPHVIQSALRGENIPLTEGAQERDFVYIDDLVEGMILAAGAKDVEAVNLCRGEAWPVRRMVEAILARMGHPVRADFGALPYRQGEMWVQSGSPDLARRVLGWTPATGMEEGLDRTIAWFREKF